LNSFVKLFFFLRLKRAVVLIATNVSVGGPAEYRSVFVLLRPLEITKVSLVVIHDVVDHLLRSDTTLIVWQRRRLTSCWCHHRSGRRRLTLSSVRWLAIRRSWSLIIRRLIRLSWRRVRSLTRL
jgi:hypothetical protein